MVSGTAFGRSLFERLQEGGLPVNLLTTQYRMHPSISFFPSQRFYNGALKDSLRTKKMLSIFKPEFCDGDIVIRGCRFKLGHYCFMDVGWGIEREEIIGHSRANFEEALVVCNAVEGVVKGLLPGLKLDLGIITPYIAQRGVIEHQLEKRGIDSTACEVNTVDGFQGREKDVIVLSCVRAMADRGLGFVSDEKRMNVALTRAKYSLIIVGHAKTLQKWSPSWSALLDDARKRGCYQLLTNKKAQDFSTKNWYLTLLTFISFSVELSFNPTGFLVQISPYDFLMVVLHTISIISFHLWCMLEVVFEFERRAFYINLLRANK